MDLKISRLFQSTVHIMENMNSGDESDHDIISTDMLEDIRDGSQTHPNVNKREAHYKYVIVLGIGSGMKWETSEPDYPKDVNSCEISFTTVLDTLCKPFPMLHISFNSPFHYDCLCLTRSHIYNVLPFY